MAAGSNATITEEMYRASLLSAVEDKIRRRLRDVFDQAQVSYRLQFHIYIQFSTTVFAVKTPALLGTAVSEQ